MEDQSRLCLEVESPEDKLWPYCGCELLVSGVQGIYICAAKFDYRFQSNT
jgi:hypothetical protein